MFDANCYINFSNKVIYFSGASMSKNGHWSGNLNLVGSSLNLIILRFEVEVLILM
jgi:hypothetical protein